MDILDNILNNILDELVYFFDWRTLFNFKRKWKVRKTNFGRSQGWEVYVGEEKVAELLEPDYVEMFWVSYKLTEVAPAYEAEVNTLKFWDNSAVRFKSKAMDEFLGQGAIIVVTEHSKNEQVLARGLYFHR